MQSKLDLSFQQEQRGRSDWEVGRASSGAAVGLSVFRKAPTGPKAIWKLFIKKGRKRKKETFVCSAI